MKTIKNLIIISLIWLFFFVQIWQMIADKSYFDSNYENIYNLSEKTKWNFKIYQDGLIENYMDELDANNIIIKKEYSERIKYQNTYNNKYNNSYLPINIDGDIIIYTNNPNPSKISNIQFSDYKIAIQKIIDSRKISEGPSERNKIIGNLIKDHNQNFKQKTIDMSKEIQETNQIIDEYNNYYIHHFRIYNKFWIDFKTKNIPKIESNLPIFL